MRTDPPTTADRVEQLYPLDGPHTDDEVREAAKSVDHLMHYLAHATLPVRAETSVEVPSSVSVVVNALASAATREAQVLQQLAQRLDEFAVDPRLYDDGMGKRLDNVEGKDVANVRAGWAAAELRIGREKICDGATELALAFKQLDRLGIRD